MRIYKILLIDDEINIRETLTELLTFENYEVITANNGQEALDILNNWIPDLIISDIMMPVMDGNMLHEIVREDKLLSSIPFIFLTAKKESNNLRECLLNGADDYISKPFKINDLLKTIEIKIDKFEKIKNAFTNFNFNKNNNLFHEINNPISGIINSVNALIENQDNLEKDKVMELYNSIKMSGKKLNRTMQNLALYQNLQDNTATFSEDSYSSIYDAFLKVKEQLSKIYGNELKRIYSSIDKFDIKISQDYLHFVLFELIDNSLRFSKKNKKIIISGVRYNDEYYELVIKDSGIGFKEEELKKIDATQQFDREGNEQQGLGLGIFLSKSIIKKTKGVFSIVSKKNHGTTIKIFFPLKIEKACM